MTASELVMALCLDPRLDLEAVVIRLRARRTGLKRALLDQTLVSGIGNIYADEALWRARLHGARPTETLTRPEARRVLGFAREVMLEALGEGGTSFDRRSSFSCPRCQPRPRRPKW